ncbi:hypothetical protein NP233_g9807 [Leucocoprinus birnbaumii]|uniref:HMG domain-containing protein n=1 Tax=Leucocoprinus birnbaumii TaxID=56174 RepID=A0AAD5YSI9_9AGAR|nr:hypothetical protein NP233_g9807 [Leucocoprinus birnbaumii]
MDRPKPRFLKSLAGTNEPLQKYPGVLPPTVQEAPVSIFSKKADVREIASPTKRTRAGDLKPRAKRPKIAQGSTKPTKKMTHKTSVALSFSENTPQTPSHSDADAFEFTAPDEPPVFDYHQSVDQPDLHDSEFAEFLDAVRGGCAGFEQFAKNLCVVQGWDVRRSQATSHWYHLQFVDTGEGLRAACQCPIHHCFHKRFIHESHHEGFFDNRESLSQMPYASEVPVYMFSRERIVDDIHKNIFSVTTNSATTPMNRAIVMYEGIDTGPGRWTCSKDSKEQIQRGGFCIHIKRSRREMAQRLNVDLDDLEDVPLPSGQRIREPVVRKIKEKPAISYLPILCPRWAELPTDRPLYPRPRPIWESPADHLFTISPTSSCICSGGERTYFDDSKPTILNDATLYTLVGSFPCRIELQPCPKCPAFLRNYIGPDLREAGVFNYNNTTLLTHDFLDDYTSFYTSSETPFDAWCEVVIQRYTYTPNAKFMHKDLFRSCWFAYATLQQFDDDFRCPECGPLPDNIIWDGVSLAFSRAQLSGSLEPPTSTSSLSPVRPCTRYLPKQQVIPNPSLRKMIRGAIAMEALEEIANKANSSKGNSRKSSTPQSQQAVNAVSGHIDNIALVVKQLGQYNTDLASLFDCWFGITAFHNGLKPPAAVKNFFRQVAAEESVAQMVNQDGLLALGSFLESPTPNTARKLIKVPHIYFLLRFDYDEGQPGYSSSILSICVWIKDRARDVFQSLFANAGPGVNHDLNEIIDTDWKTTGCFYSLPKIRQRPVYPLLSNEQQDQGNQKSAAEAEDTSSALCGKYFSSYSQRRLTGGIMAAWCPHSICYGFHFMPGYEGRNDPFSAMITRWPKAPKRVIYDFSCALGPYCLLREPQFFADTLFIIDNFHSRDHTKCAPACFASTYAQLDPQVSEINTSAAESGNSLILRIRKAEENPGMTRPYSHHCKMPSTISELLDWQRKSPSSLLNVQWKDGVVWNYYGEGWSSLDRVVGIDEWGVRNHETQVIGEFVSFSPTARFSDGKEVSSNAFPSLAYLLLRRPRKSKRLASSWTDVINNVMVIEAKGFDLGSCKYSLLVDAPPEDLLIGLVVNLATDFDAGKPPLRLGKGDLLRVKFTIQRIPLPGGAVANVGVVTKTHRAREEEGMV